MMFHILPCGWHPFSEHDFDQFSFLCGSPYGSEKLRRYAFYTMNTWFFFADIQRFPELQCSDNLYIDSDIDFVF